MKYALLALIVILGALAVFGVIYSKVLFSPKADSGQTEPQISVGPEQQVFTSNTEEHIPDFPYITVDAIGGRIGVLSIGGFGNQRAFKVANPLSTNLGPLSPIEGIVKGTDRNNIDWGGVWLSSTYRVPNSNTIHGFYHAETHTGSAPADLSNDVWTIAHIQSDNGGQSWYKPNYPNNLTLTAVGYPKADGINATSLIKVGNDAYLYYYENTESSNKGMHLAKAPISQIGNATAWKKYYCTTSGSCGFTEPGIGGKSTPLQTIQGDSPVSYNTYLNKFLTVSEDSNLTKNPLQFAVSSDGINFTKIGSPIRLERNLGPGWKYVYSSLIGTNGVTSETGQSFYLYYVLLKWDPTTQTTTDPNRYLMRRLITLSNIQTPTATLTPSQSPSVTPTATPQPTVTPTKTPSPSPSATPTNSPKKTFTCATPGSPGCFDCNTDGAISILDFSCFRSAYGTQISSLACKIAGDKACSNCNSDQVINILDFSCFAKNYNKSY